MTQLLNETEFASWHHLVDSLPERSFDQVAVLAAVALAAPAVVISLWGNQGWVVKGASGLSPAQGKWGDPFGLPTLPQAAWVVPDTMLDPRFKQEASVAGPPHLRFYAGVPLTLESGLTVGTLAVMDTSPRDGLTEHQAHLLGHVASLIVEQLHARRETARQQGLERLHHDVIHNVQDVVFQTDSRGCWSFLNSAWSRLTGHDTQSSLGRSALEFIHPDDQAQVQQAFGTVLTGQAATCRQHVRHVTAGGAFAWFDVYARAVHDSQGRVTGAAGTLRDITGAKQAELHLRAEKADLERRVREHTHELAQLSAQAQHDALRDPLTGLGNRTMFQHRLRGLLEDGWPARRAAVVLLDCDRFKQLNDTFGHSAGDELLRLVAGRLAREVRGPDTLSRLGGDEFGLLLGGVDTPEMALGVMQRVLRVVQQTATVQGREWPVQVSAGVVLLHDQDHAVDEVLRNADIALCHAKRRTRDKVEVFKVSMHTALLARTELEDDLRQALRNGDLHPHYQPLVRVQDGHLVGFEALARWNHPERGPISPAEFIPVAEDSGLIIDLDRAIFEQACAQYQQWQAAGLMSAPLTLSSNASARQFLLPDFAPFVQATLARTGLSANLVHLEITESLILEQSHVVTANLAALQALGVHLHIDDFGTGYSSLAYVQRLAASALKIDRSFTNRIGQAEAGEELVRAILGMARALGMHVVAEGVETDEQWVWLREVGCDLAQGFHFSRPLAALDAEALVQRAALEAVKAFSPA
ncbi:EAL domain-containing protein [Deinococcus deserti]|nr:EAL domain-containing protein [Deinococcus deserti]